MLFQEFFFQAFDNVFFDFEFDEIDCKIFKSINKNEYVTIKIVTFDIDDENVNIIRILVIRVEIINVFKEFNLLSTFLLSKTKKLLSKKIFVDEQILIKIWAKIVILIYKIELTSTKNNTFVILRDIFSI